MKPSTRTDLQVRGIPERLEHDLALPPMDDWIDAVAALPKADLTDIDTAELVRHNDAARTEKVIRRSSFSTRRSRSTS